MPQRGARGSAPLHAAAQRLAARAHPRHLFLLPHCAPRLSTLSTVYDSEQQAAQMNLQHARAVGGARLASAPEARPSARPCTRQPSRRAPLVVSAQRRHVVEAATLVKEERLERPAQHQHLQDPRPADQPPRDAQAAPTTPPPPAGAVVPEWLPKLALLGAAALWGSYAPSVRLLYESAQPPDAAVILAVRGMLQSGALVLASLALQAPSASNNESSSGSSASSGSGSSASSSSGSIASRSSTGDGDVPLLERWLFLRSPPLWMAALELGAWNYSATMLQVGLQPVVAAATAAGTAAGNAAPVQLRRMH